MSFVLHFLGKLGSIMSEFVKGFIKGAKETPKGFFAPLIVIWHLLIDVTDSLTLAKDE